MTPQENAALQALALWWTQLRKQYQHMAENRPDAYPQLDQRRVLFFGTRGIDYCEVAAHHLDTLTKLAEEQRQ